MTLRFAELLVLLMGLIPMVLMLVALIDLSRATDEQMTSTGFHRYAWLAVIIVIPVLGSIAYFVAKWVSLRRLAETIGGQVASAR